MLAGNVDLKRRRPVWEAISDLWTDTELDEDDFARIAGVLAASRYSLAEIREIYVFEVAPVVWTNLYPFYPIIPTVWAGFDAEWLADEIVKNIERQRKGFVYRQSVRSGAGQWMRTLAVREDWRRVLEILTNEHRVD